MKKIYGIDIRSIAAFRIILSLFIAMEFSFMVLGNFTEIYSPETGVLGNAFAKDFHSFYNGFIGIFSIQSDLVMKLFVYLIIAVMLMLCIGFYPRIMAITGCILLYLFFNRYSLLYFGWEMYASVMLFWLAFVPQSSVFSFLKIEKNAITNYSSGIAGNNVGAGAVGKKEWHSPLAFALIFQIGIIYFYNGISKNGELWMTGRAVESFLNDADKARPLAAWVLESNWITGFSVFLTYFTLIAEIGLIFILFIPWKNKQLRYLAAFLIFSLHWGIDIFVDVGNFKYVATAVAILILPGDFWDRIVHFLDRLKLPTKRTEASNSLIRSVAVISKIKLPGLNISANYTLEKILACTLCFTILFSNLSQTNASMTTDRMKHVIELLNIDKVLKKVNHSFLPQYSFFTQYWHLYSPDPPKENGYMQVEVITDKNDTLSVFNGVPLEKKRYYSSVQHNLFTYLLLKKGRNEKEKIAEKYLVLREIRLWNKQPEKDKIRSLQLVIYSRLFDKNKKIQSGLERSVYKTIDVKYR
ncbi:MAG: HTTM domain-containing protein [Bacteroidota bacterium]